MRGPRPDDQQRAIQAVVTTFQDGVNHALLSDDRTRHAALADEVMGAQRHEGSGHNESRACHHATSSVFMTSFCANDSSKIIGTILNIISVVASSRSKVEPTGPDHVLAGLKHVG